MNHRSDSRPRRARARRGGDHLQGLRLGRLRLLLGDVALLGHHLEDQVPPGQRRLRPGVGRVEPRVPDDGRQEGRLGQGELGDVLSEVVAAGRLHAVDPRPPVDLIQVRLQDLFLRVLPLDLDGPENLPQFTGEGLLVGEEGVLGQLLGDGAAALKLGPCPQIDDGRPEDGGDVDAVVVVKLLVFDGDHRVQEALGHLVDGDRDPALPVADGDFVTVAVVKVGDRLGIEGDLIKAGGAGQVRGEAAAAQPDQQAEREGGEENDERPSGTALGWLGQAPSLRAVTLPVLYHTLSKPRNGWNPFSSAFPFLAPSGSPGL